MHQTVCSDLGQNYVVMPHLPHWRWVTCRSMSIGTAHGERTRLSAASAEPCLCAVGSAKRTQQKCLSVLQLESAAAAAAATVWSWWSETTKLNTVTWRSCATTRRSPPSTATNGASFSTMTTTKTTTSVAETAPAPLSSMPTACRPSPSNAGAADGTSRTAASAARRGPAATDSATTRFPGHWRTSSAASTRTCVGAFVTIARTPSSSLQYRSARMNKCFTNRSQCSAFLLSSLDNFSTTVGHVYRSSGICTGWGRAKGQ